MRRALPAADPSSTENPPEQRDWLRGPPGNTDATPAALHATRSPVDASPDFRHSELLQMPSAARATSCGFADSPDAESPAPRNIHDRVDTPLVKLGETAPNPPAHPPRSPSCSSPIPFPKP